MKTITGLEELKAAEGEILGTSDWYEVTQADVNAFADVTGDHQWIHVDVERANAESPFGGPIAHGYLTLSLAPSMVPQVVQVHGFSMAVNYGAGKVRFPSPVPVGSKLRAGVELTGVEDVKGGVQVEMRLTFEVEGAAKPSCVAEVLYRYFV
jgi:acyl dehydratase